MRETIRAVTRGRLTALYRRDEAGTVELLLVPAGMQAAVCRDDCAAEPLVQLKRADDDGPGMFGAGRTMRGAPSTRALQYRAQTLRESAEGAEIVTALDDGRGLQVTHTLCLFDSSPATALTVSVRNTASIPITLELLTGFTLGSLSPFAKGLAPETLVIHRMRSTWSAEGRIVTEPAEQLQLEPGWKPCSAANTLRFGALGSFPLNGFAPFCAVEDTAHGVTWAAATTHASSWQMELYRQDFGLSFSGGLPDWEFGHWRKALAPGGEFHAPPARLAGGRAAGPHPHPHGAAHVPRGPVCHNAAAPRQKTGAVRPRRDPLRRQIRQRADGSGRRGHLNRK